MAVELERSGLEAVERLRAHQLTRGVDISRASMARAGGVSDVQLWKILNRPIEVRADTVVRAAAGLLIRMIDNSGAKVVSDSGQEIQRQVDLAAQKVALAAPVAVVKGGDKRKLRAALPALDEALADLPIAHHRRANALRHAAHAFLDDGEDDGVRLALTGAAIAVWNQHPALQAVANG